MSTKTVEEGHRVVTDPNAEGNNPAADNTAGGTYEPGMAPLANSGKGSNAGAAHTLGSLRNTNKDALIAIATKRGVDLTSARNNGARADLIWADIQKKGTPELIEASADTGAVNEPENNGSPEPSPDAQSTETAPEAAATSQEGNTEAETQTESEPEPEADTGAKADEEAKAAEDAAKAEAEAEAAAKAKADEVADLVSPEADPNAEGNNGEDDSELVEVILNRKGSYTVRGRRFEKNVPLRVPAEEAERLMETKLFVEG